MTHINNQTFCLKSEKYETPEIRVLTFEAYNSVLVASNEGLEYEDLFASPQKLLEDETSPGLL